MTAENKVPSQPRIVAWSSAYEENDSWLPYPPSWERFKDHLSDISEASLFTLGRALRGALAVTLALYILNQQHVLPKPLSAVVSQVLFWPTLPITVVRRLGAWSTVVDDTLLVGGAPFGFANYPDRLYHDYGVRGVINLCQEYIGPCKQYKQLGIDHLRLPTVDHFQSPVKDLERAVTFIQKHREKGEKVYVHCRAGHGRSAAVVMAWMLYNHPDADRLELNQEFCGLRNVRTTLWKQQNIVEFHRGLLRGDLDVPERSSIDDSPDGRCSDVMEEYDLDIHDL